MKQLFIILFVFSPLFLIGQTKEEFKKLIIDKEWKISMYEEDGDKFPPSPESSNNKMIFYSNNTVKSIEQDKTDIGTWTFDFDTKTVTIIDSNTGLIVKLIVVKLIADKFIVELIDPDGASLVMHMKTDK